jgi:ubiquinone biosynthesis protein
MKKEDLKIVFMGTPDFALGCLKALVENNFNVVGVFSQPDKPKGRGMKLMPTPTKEYAESRNIPVYQPLKLKNNEEVIVKIQRPNIEETIKSDIEILRTIASTLKDLNNGLDIDLKQVVEEFNAQLMRELNYTFEAMNAIKFKSMFKDSAEVYIPSIYEEYSTEKVLVMEKIVGVKISDKSKIKKLGWSTKNIAEIGVRSLFKQVFEYGFFHGDPHPGNIFVVSNNCISYIDFGMIGIIDRKMLNFLNNMAIAISNKNIDRVIHLLMDINILNSDIDMNSFRQDLLYLMHYYYDVPIEKLSISSILNEMFRFFRTYKIAIPSQLTMLAKTIITLEGTSRSLNPKFSIASVAEGFIKYYYINKVNLDNILTKTKDNTEELLFDIKNIPKQIKSILRNLENNNIKIQMEDIKFTSLERCIADLATNLSLSLVLASIIVGSSLIISSQNINQNVWIRVMAITGFFISFIIGLLLVIKIFRTQYRNRK